MQKIYKPLCKKIVFLLYFSLYHASCKSMSVENQKNIKSVLRSQHTLYAKKYVTFSNTTQPKYLKSSQPYIFTAEEKKLLWQTQDEFDNAVFETISEKRNDKAYKSCQIMLTFAAITTLSYCALHLVKAYKQNYEKIV